MTVWLSAACFLVLLLAMCGLLLVRAREIAVATVVLQLAGAIAAPLLVIVAVAMDRPSFIDLGLALAVTSVPAALLFANFVEHSGR